MGRKKKTTPPARMRQFTMRVTDETYEDLKRNAEGAHMSVMAYTRQLLTNRRPIVHHEIVYNDPNLLKALGDMGKIGSNLNQIARYLNEGNDWTEGMRNELMHWIAELHHMRDEIKEMAGEYRGDC